MKSATRYSHPPVNEVGITVSLADVGLFNPFNVQSLHEQLAREFPSVQRADPFDGADFEQFAGLPPLTDVPHLSRWWFISSDGSNLVQVQDNLLARNWRRLVGIDEPANYPGFDEIRSSFHNVRATISEWHRRQNTRLPNPRAVELMYDDVIGAPKGQTRALLSSVLNHVQREPNDGDSRGEFVPMGNWQNAWLERIPVDDSEATLSVQIVAASLPSAEGEEVRPVIRILWKASMLVAEWEQVDTFLDAAHAYIAHRFDSLITDEAKLRWSAQ
ncbi:TIGR04255 family protein [Sphingomonas sp. 22R3R2A-7]|uniref:TIGR04255 family protein n=1 Tax=Sphingomonas sp. 22R3R2A-7 TaxID=3050230 RepID=UPI002FE26645